MEDVRDIAHRPSCHGSSHAARMIKISQDVAVLQGSWSARVQTAGRGRRGQGSIREFSVRWTIERGMAPRARISQNNSRPLFRLSVLFQSSLPCSACPRRPSCCSHRQSRGAQTLHHRSSAVRAGGHENLCRIDAARRCQTQFQFAARCSDCPNTSPLQFQQLQY